MTENRIVYEVRVDREIAKMLDGKGIRRRAGFVFSAQPTYLDSLPKAVEEDPKLRWKEIPGSEARGPVLHVALPGEGDPPAKASVDPTDPDADLKALGYNALVQKARALGLDASGKKPELLARLLEDAAARREVEAERLKLEADAEAERLRIEAEAKKSAEDDGA